jgi:hypothetical protein
MYRHTRALLAGLAVVLPGCQMTGADAVVDPQLVRFCQQQGYGADTGERHQWCLEQYSMAGRGLQLDPRAAGMAGGGP